MLKETCLNSNSSIAPICLDEEVFLPLLFSLNGQNSEGGFCFTVRNDNVPDFLHRPENKESIKHKIDIVLELQYF
jgi:hypothetical protein